MRVLLTGGGTGGHFYPLIAVAESLNDIAREQKLLTTELYYMGPTPFDEKALFDNRIEYFKASAGKRRIYSSVLNFFDFFKTGWGIFMAVLKVFWLYPDVVFSKGGYASIPAVIAARLFRIPLVIHESDSVPGRANAWAAHFARTVAVSYVGAGEHFGKTKEPILVSGNPIRKSLLSPHKEGAHEFLQLENNVPVVFITGGSQGAQLINETFLDALPDLLPECQIIHQVGEANLEGYWKMASVVLEKNQFAKRYKTFGFLNELALRMAAASATLVVSRASSTIFEIANWGVPSIIIPITDSNGDHQRQNAFEYARSGAAVVIEEKNLTSHLLTAEIKRLLQNNEEREKMGRAAKSFAKPEAARIVAEKILSIALEHET